MFKPALNLQDSGLFNVAGDESLTITELVKLIERVLGKRAILAHTKNDPNGDLLGDNSRIKQVLKVHPKVDLLEGLKRMI
ncbi:MAG: hypothetical protein GTO24_05435 [candidate division Zixibacteria bacterium]|nr:hypothetical protein [candidate division Zixibacteria bacterium]